MSEKLTRELIESHLMSFIEIESREQRDGVTRWAWVLSPVAGESHVSDDKDREMSFEFKSFEAARNFALGWIRRHRPMFYAAAVQEAKDGIKYRASRV